MRSTKTNKKYFKDIMNFTNQNTIETMADIKSQRSLDEILYI